MATAAPKSTALWVVRRLRRAGFRALFAGGCVRDMLLGRRCADYDVATDATPEQVRRLFGRVLLVGAKFGVAMVLHKGRRVEVTTFRSDADYHDGRHPQTVRFSTPREDALRRDFTINGMFYDAVARRVIDYVGGRKDLARRVVRTIGRPEQRFAEDYLRMLRAVRFATRLDFAISARTSAAVRKYAPRIVSISGERIYDELTKMLSVASAGRAQRALAALGLAQVVLAGLFAREGLWAAALRRVETVARRRDPLLTLAALTVDLPARAIRRMLRAWGASNDVRNALCWLAGHHADWPRAPQMPLCDLKRLMACAHFGRLRVLWREAEWSGRGERRSARGLARRVAGIDPDQIAPAPLVTGEDLKDLGLKEGPELGRIHRALYDAQLNETLRTRGAALRAARQHIRRLGKPPS